MHLMGRNRETAKPLTATNAPKGSWTLVSDLSQRCSLPDTRRNTRHPLNGLSGLLTPVVNYVGIGPIEALRVRALHGDNLHGDPISASAHAPVGIFASRVHACLYGHSP